MQLSSLHLNNFRNFECYKLSDLGQFNIICGENGSGKTSLLEAIYYLAHTKSFRTHLNTRITHYEKLNFSLVANIDGLTEHITLGIERNAQGSHTLRYNSESISSIAPITQLLPIQLMSNLSYTLFSSGPQSRRKYLNWGLFHVKPEFYPLWKQFRIALKQRNSSLKQKLAKREISHWNLVLQQTSEAINNLRVLYFEEIKPIINDILSCMLGDDHQIVIRYYPGWDTSQNLFELLESYYYRDIAIGYTQQGAHRADIQLLKNSVPIQHYLSQGQQKLVGHALSLAQGKHLEEATGKHPIYLIDDLPSELDSKKLEKVLDILNEINSQIFITSIYPNSLVIKNKKVSLYEL